MRNYPLIFGLSIVIVVLMVLQGKAYKRAYKPYPKPQKSLLGTDLLLKQPILSPFSLWLSIMDVTWHKRLSCPWPIKTTFTLYDEGIVARVPGKTVQLSYKDIAYFKARGINDVVLFTKLETPTLIAVKINKYHEVQQLLASKGIERKE